MNITLASSCLSVGFMLAGALTSAALAQPAGGGALKPSETTTWAKGVVRDAAGQPVQGAKVYARATYYGAIRMYGLLHSAMTDADGRYSIEGEKNLASFSASLVAHVPGRPPAFAWIRSERNWDATGSDLREVNLPKGDIDLVIPSRGGAMEVLITRGGKPAAEVDVALRLQGADPFDHWGLESQTEVRKELYAICRPVRRTDPGGIARFEALAPGLYSIFAAEGDDRSALRFTEYSRWFPFGDEPTYGEARDVPVRADQTTAHRLAMFRHGCVVKFTILRDGQDWIAEERLIPQSKSLSGDSEYSPTWIGKEWTDTFRFEKAGLKQLSFIKYTGSSGYPRSFPFDSADGVIAASPRLSNTVPVTLVASPNHGAGIFVRIEDAEGRPLAGLARFGNASFKDVGKEGSLIRGFEPGSGAVEGRASGVTRIFPSENMGTIPADDALVGRTEILRQQVTVGVNEVREVTLKPKSVGYVKGRLRVPEGQSLVDYQLSLGRRDYESGAGVFLKRDTGEFLAGPMRSGTVTLYVSRRWKPGPLLQRKVSVQAGQLAEADLELPADVKEPAPQARSVIGQVVLADGKTPAYLAAVARHFPAEGRPWGVGMTDYRGKIWPQSLWVPYRENDPELPGTPRDPYVAAWLPGQNGVTIVPVPEGAERPATITLGPAISVSGKVSVEGDGETIDNGTIRVRAQHAGLGKLDDLLSVETTAGADGVFELAGLTPGTYRVQAALDGIWLSASVAMTVGGETTPDRLALKIPAPGGPVLVRVTHAGGDAVPEKLYVTRPLGPLTERLWPAHFTPDGAGIVRIPALEAGEHTIRVGEQTRVVAVSPLTQSAGRPLEISLERGEEEQR